MTTIMHTTRTDETGRTVYAVLCGACPLCADTGDKPGTLAPNREDRTMRVTVTDTTLLLHADGDDTYNWAHKPGAVWPCSVLAGQPFRAMFDRNGLLDFASPADSGDLSGAELSACAADLLEATGKVPADHPARYVAIDQFRAEG